MSDNDNGNEKKQSKSYQTVAHGISFGSALAITISYTANHSILWAILHGALGWLYVIYFALK